MNVVSYQFALLVLTGTLVFYLLNPKYRTLLLVILSYGFIASFSFPLILFVLIYSLFNYFIALKIPGSKSKQLILRAGIIVNLALLIILRYSSFAIDPLFQLFGSNIQISKISEIIIPIGISYFTLQGIGYLFNVKMGWEKPERSFINFLLYISFFPKFISGPIERSNHFLPQLRVIKNFNTNQVSEGLRIAFIGFFKKMAIANPLAQYALDVYSINQAGGSISWLIFIIQPLYLYFDFSGYTDIAVGTAKMFGLELLPNFQRPFFSENVSTFWKKFHISLSSWFNDYVFKQASFKYRRWGIYSSAYAVFLTWILFGIWHGAGWNFMLIGLLQALAINYEFFTKKLRLRLFSNLPSYITVWFGRFITYLFYCLSLVFFFSPDIKVGLHFLANLSSFSGPSPFTDISTKPFQVLIYIPVFLFMEFLRNDYSGTYDKLEQLWMKDRMVNKVFRWTVYSTMLTIVYIAGFRSQQFIYANF